MPKKFKGHAMAPLPEFIQFKKDMEAAGYVVAIYDDGTPFVHTCDTWHCSRHTSVRTDHFTEAFDNATKCFFPVVEDRESVLTTL